MENKKKKGKIIGIILGVLALLLIALCLWLFVFGGLSGGEPGESAFVTKVSEIMQGGALGLQNRFSGVVEPQQELKVKKDPDKQVGKLLVAEGQQVKVGDVLFEYDVEEISLSLEQAKLELESLENAILSFQSTLEDLKAQQKKASEKEQLSFTIEIHSTELDIKNKEYEKTQKSKEIEKLEASMENTEVRSEIDGVIKEINENAADPETPYISILSTGNYRVKGVISELNLSAIYTGEPVIIRSRVSEETWRGVIDTIDRESPVSSENNGFYYYDGYYDGTSSEKASKYNFYVALEEYENLILGQHVYVEPDKGQEERKEGVWIPSYYIAADDMGSFVWAKGGWDRLEKRAVTLGETDESTGLTQIVSGLSEEDEIAYPTDELTEGMPTTNDMPVEDPGTGLPGEGMGGIDPGFQGVDDSSGYAEYPEENVIPETDGEYWPEGDEEAPAGYEIDSMTPEGDEEAPAGNGIDDMMPGTDGGVLTENYEIPLPETGTEGE